MKFMKNIMHFLRISIENFVLLMINKKILEKYMKEDNMDLKRITKMAN